MTQAEIAAHQGSSKCIAKAAIVASQHETPVLRLCRRETFIFVPSLFYHPDCRIGPLVELLALRQVADVDLDGKPAGKADPIGCR